MKPAPRHLILLLVVVALIGVRVYQGFDGPPVTDDQQTIQALYGGTIEPIDGDTFRYNGTKIRVMSIDTPEPSKYGNAECQAEARLGDKASKFTETIITTRDIKIEWSGKEDRYGRALAKVRVGNEYLGDMLIEAGLAKPWKGRQVDWCAIL